MASLSFLALFLAISLALAWVLLFFKIRARFSGQSGWVGAYRFWVRIFALSFVLTLASALPVLIQIASLWSGLMDRIGNVAGPLLGYGVLSVFVLKSCFLGVMLFGQRRVSDSAHTLAVFMVAVGQVVAVAWVLSLQSWMQTPDGATLIDGRYQVYNWAAVIFNPSFGWHLAQLLLGAVLAAAFLMLGVTALQALRRPLDEGERFSCKTALIMGLTAAILQFPVGWKMGEVIAQYQPATAAALAGYWQTGTPPAVLIVAWPDADTQSNRAQWAWPNHGGRWLAKDIEGAYVGLDKYSGMQPPVAFVFMTLRVRVLLGVMMLGVALVSLLMLCRRAYDMSFMPRGWLRVLVGTMFAGGLSVVLGVWVVQAGLQPYAVHGSVTQSEVLSRIPVSTFWYGLGGYALLYGVMLVAFIIMLLHAARYGVVPVRKTGGMR